MLNQTGKEAITRCVSGVFMAGSGHDTSSRRRPWARVRAEPCPLLIAGWVETAAIAGPPRLMEAKPDTGRIIPIRVDADLCCCPSPGTGEGAPLGADEGLGSSSTR